MQYITTGDLKRELSAFLLHSVMLGYENGILTDQQYADMLDDISEIETMPDDEFHDWWKLMHE